MASICIYCKREGPEATFGSREHVMWDAFGGFKDPLVLRGVVCDDCNQAFGDGLDRYLARDTIEGLCRFRFDVKPATGYRSEGKRSKLTTRIAEGRWAGAVVWYCESDGVLRPTPAPQVGFGRTYEGPFDFWFMADALPSVERERELFDAGYRCVEFLSIEGAQAEDNTDAIKALAARMRLQFDGEPTVTMPLGLTDVMLVGDSSLLDAPFWRAVAKGAFNYFAFVHGAEAALNGCFDTIRDFIRLDMPPTFDFRVDKSVVFTKRQPGHSYEMTVGGFGTPSLEGRLRLLTGVVYVVPLATQGVPSEYLAPRGHIFDLDSMTIAERAHGH
jgi:hypothetical protein